ncbi:MAG: CapA family protein [Myxococcaceae bacterium]|nr:CapA family protein [Myxococcaceae bacterium]
MRARLDLGGPGGHHGLVLATACALLVTAATDGGAPLRVTFAGDVTLGFHVEEWADTLVAKGTPKDQALTWGFERVAPLTRAADLFVVNLECPFTDKGEKLQKNFNFRARPELLAGLLAGGVDVVSLANNHLMDYGPEGLFDTLTVLDTGRIARFGAGRTRADARAPALVEVQGVKLAFLGYFFLGDRNIEPREVIATATTPGVAGHFSDAAALEAMLVADVRAARKRADHVIPFFHWGREGRGQPEPYQVALAHAAIDAGASAVIGSHPHVLQGIELYRGKPVVYSLGNFVFGGNWNPTDKRTALVHLLLTKAGLAGVEVTPARSDDYPDRPCQPFLAEGAQADDVLDHLARLSAAFPATLPQLRARALPDAGVAREPPAP